MAGTKAGGQLAAKKNRAKHGADFYKRIGAMGGKASNTGGFAQGEEGRARAREWGKVGGAMSRRT